MTATGPLSAEEVICAIHQAALDERPWQGILHALVAFFDLTSAAATVPGADGQAWRYLVCGCGGRRSGLRSLPAQGSAGASDLARHHVIDASFLAHGGRMGQLALHRAKNQPALTTGDRAALDGLVPHIESALHLATDAANRDMERLLYEFALDQMGIGVLFLNDEGKIVHASEVVRALIDSEDGVRQVNGRIEGSHDADTRHLRRLIDMAREQPDRIFGGAVSARSDGRSIGVTTRTVPGRAGLGGKRQPVMAMFLRDTFARSSTGSAELSQLYGFTAAEAKLSVELASGKRLGEAADALRITRNTARAHLRSIFAKANVSRQTELVRLLIK